ncbi:somatolactin-like [Synchiropus splendidus]|uniref:somatolactin-like n=1 Tax=Synchiropus splendidus TaxID=270530 RepID=UPI00237EE607|nr:somatolactin-like [Synchiropus splendidus]
MSTHVNKVEMAVAQGTICSVLLWPLIIAVTMPLDHKDEQSSLSRCLSISQGKQLDRAIRHAELIHRVLEEACTMFEEMFRPQMNKVGYACITKSLAVPGNTREIHLMSDKRLLHSVLTLVQSWIEPLVYLQMALRRYDAPDRLLYKTKWASGKLLSLQQGVVVLIKKVLDEEMPSINYTQHSLFQHDVPAQMLESVMRDYRLLSCFKKDTHKMELFLKFLRSRTRNNNCTYMTS